jgi:hypothetical protein
MGGERQWKCFYKVINRESTWRHTAQNGKYYGLGQLANSKRWSRGKPFLQIRATWDYMVHRYDGKACGAWEHSQQTGWY